jgi:YcxB-like protein
MTMEPVRYVIGEDHYLAFSRLHSVKPFRIGVGVIGGYLAFALGVNALIGGDTVIWCVAGFAAFLIALITINRFSHMPRLLKAAYREDAHIKEPTFLSYDATGYVTEYASGIVRRKWADIIKWDEDDRIFVIYSNRLLGHIFPKDQIPSDIIEDLRNYLTASGLSNQGKIRQ